MNNNTNQPRRRTRYWLAAVAMSLMSPMIASATSNVTSSVSHVMVYAGNVASGAIVFITPAIPGLEGCSNTAGNELWIDWTATGPGPDPKTLYSTIMAALLAGKVMTFGANGCGNGGALPLIYSVDVQP